MKTLIIVLIISSFFQSTILPMDLVLIILLCRAYLKRDKINLVLAFAFGLFVGHLNLQPLGPQSLIYLILVQATQILSKSRLAGNSLLIMPIILILSSINIIATPLFIHQSIHLIPQVLNNTLASLPIFYLVRLWEERFVVRKEIKLRL